MLVVAMALVLSSGCSVRRMAINKMGDALSGSGTTFASDDDPELVKQAVPFSLKLIESLLAETPRHQGLLLAATKGFTLYSYAFVQTEADLVEDKDLQAATELRDRARRLYLRARGYGLRGLEARHPGIEQRLRKEPRNAVRDLHLEDLPWVYWTSISWAAAISLSKDNPDLIADLPTVEALVDRAENLCPDYDSGGLQSFLINFESVRQHRQGDLKARIHAHYQRAMEISKGALASPLVSYAEAISVQNQNLAEFETLLNQALALDVDAHPIFRLENLITQRRAKWLLGRKDQLFLITEKPVETQ
jgi:predicted anti-sigma-YlaC factor YlaD